MILPGTGGGTAEAGGGGARQLLRPETITARKLRAEMTLPEVMLWKRLRGRAAGVKFWRQHPVGPYVADFYCREGSFVVEIDGEAHSRGSMPADDRERQAYFEQNGYRVIRIGAAEVLRDVDAVAASIASLAVSPLHQPMAGPPPRAGEE